MKRIHSMLAIPCACALLALAACGDKEKPQPPAAPAASQTAPPSAPTGTPPAAPQADAQAAPAPGGQAPRVQASGKQDGPEFSPPSEPKDNPEPAGSAVERERLSEVARGK